MVKLKEDWNLGYTTATLVLLLHFLGILKYYFQKHNNAFQFSEHVLMFQTSSSAIMNIIYVKIYKSGWYI